MFLAHFPGKPARPVHDESVEVGQACWFDLLDPTPQEKALAEKLSGLPIPDREALEEIESSSRFYVRDDSVFLSILLLRWKDENYFLSPTGFILSPGCLVTVRYSAFSAFDTVARKVAEHKAPLGGSECAVLLLEAVVDRLADILEYLGRNLEALSRDVFRTERKDRAGSAGITLRQLLQRVGKAGDMVSAVRTCLLGLDRTAIFVYGNNQKIIPAELRRRLSVASQDIRSLNDFTSQATNKVQFLLDAILGFINIDQNDGLKIMTVVGVVGVIPTLVAGIYGMNFEHMPELKWYYGYFYVLGFMLAVIVTLVTWFWRRGWLNSLGR